ncbi:MAG: hypothetical protein ACR2F8_14545 [Caulobacteraceae bacterium]
MTLIEVLAAVGLTVLVTLLALTNLQPRMVIYAQHQTVAVVAERLREAHADALARDGPVAAAVAAGGRALGVSGMSPAITPAGVGLASPGGRTIVFFGDGSSNGGVIWVTAAGHTPPVWVVTATGSVAVGRKG